MSPSSAVAPPPASAADDVSKALQVLRSYCKSKKLDVTSEVRMSPKPHAGGGFADVHIGDRKRLWDWFVECVIYTATWGAVAGEPAEVAVKVLRVDTKSRGHQPRLAKDIRRLRQEIAVWRRLKHCNVQELIGVMWLEHQPIPAMVSKWEPKGNLYSYLFPPKSTDTKPRKVPTLVQKLTLLQDILRGLMYLHRKNVIHADLKGENVLISSEGKALLCDFGIAWMSVKISVSFTSKRQGQGTHQYMAPELLSGDFDGNESLYTHASDIWAFGCLAKLVLAGAALYSNKETDPTMIAAVLRQEFFPRHADMDNSQWALVLSCCSFVVRKRATSDFVRDQLRVQQLLLRKDLPPEAETICEEYRTAMQMQARADEAEARTEIVKKMKQATENLINRLRSKSLSHLLKPSCVVQSRS